MHMINFIVAFADEGVEHSQIRELDGSSVGHVLAMEIQNSSLTILHCSRHEKKATPPHERTLNSAAAARLFCGRCAPPYFAANVTVHACGRS